MVYHTLVFHNIHSLYSFYLTYSKKQPKIQNPSGGKLENLGRIPPKMIFTPGPVISAASGSVGGTVFSRNRGGSYTRMRAVPITSTTPEALAAKTRFSDASQDWQLLTEAQRLSWQEWSNANPVTNALGFPKVLSGAQAYIGIAARMAAAGDSPITSPPIISAPDPLITIAQDADIGTGAVEVVFTATPLGANEELWIRAAITSSAGINYVQNLLRLVGQSAAAQTSPFDNQSMIESRLGTLSVGQTLHVEISVYDNSTGLVSGPLRSDVVVDETV